MPLLVTVAVLAESPAEAESRVRAWAESVALPDPENGVAAVALEVPDAGAEAGADVPPLPGVRARFTFPLRGEVTPAGRAVSPAARARWQAKVAEMAAAGWGIAIVQMFW